MYNQMPQHENHSFFKRKSQIEEYSFCWTW